MSAQVFMRLFIVFFTTLFSLNAWAQNYLPSVLTSEMKDPRIQSALQAWSKLDGSNDVMTNSIKKMHLSSIQIDGQPWLNVYSEINFFVLPHATAAKDFFETLDDEIATMSNNYNDAGKKVHVQFDFFIRIYQIEKKSSASNGAPRFLKSFGKQRSNVDVNPIRAEVHPRFDLFWQNENFAFDDGSGRAFALPSKNTFHLAANELDAMTHELNHVLFNSRDAYYKTDGQLSGAQCSALWQLNANSDATSIHPLEIYVGLKKIGYTIPYWKNFVKENDKLAFKFDSSGHLFFQDFAGDASDFYSIDCNIYNDQNIFIQKANKTFMNGFYFTKRYEQTNCGNDEFQKYYVNPHPLIDLDLPAGKYLLECEAFQINQSANEADLSAVNQPEFFRWRKLDRTPIEIH